MCSDSGATRFATHETLQFGFNGTHFTDRRLKIRSSYYDYRLSSGTRPLAVPLIELKGYWLEQAGFMIGNEVQVFMNDRELIIRTASTETHSDNDLRP